MLEPANIKVDAPLDGYKQGLSQLAHIGNHIWSNMAAYGSDRFCPRYTVNVLKLQTLVSFRTRTHKLLVRKANREDPDQTASSEED